MTLLLLLTLAAPPNHSTGRCSRCHTPDGWNVLPERLEAFDHSTTGFELRGRHKPVRCTDCHGATLATEQTRTACQSCHQDPHRGTLGATCDDCHSPRGWQPSPRVLRHRQTRFPPAGSHAAVDCGACHVRARRETYRGTPTECFACHRDDYLRRDLHVDHVAAGIRTECDTCHSQYLWRPARIRHELYWPLRGAHTGLECADCHDNGRFGGTPRECIGCHLGDYNAAAHPPHASLGMSTACANCHVETMWSPVLSTWHEAAFPILAGDHAVPCGDCHTGRGGFPKDYSCTGCHGRSETDHEHDRAGYVYQDAACYGCHPRGEEDD